MTNATILETFRTHKHPYLHNRHMNSTVILTENRNHELPQIKKSKAQYEHRPVTKKCRKLGIFNPNAAKKVERSSPDILGQYLKNRMKRLTLQVAQQSTLYCEDCASSGPRPNMRMSLETAKRAIDFFLERSSELSDVVLGFRGGEPLLEFELIKQCVEYAKSQVEGKRIAFNMATNGMLLSHDIADYLAENNFALNTGLDGEDERQAAYRSGPCIPGVRQIFVRADGALFPCELVNEELDYFKIGMLDYGIDIDRIRKMLDLCSLAERECNKYWSVRQCVFYTGQNALDEKPLGLYDHCVSNDFALDME